MLVDVNNLSLGKDDNGCQYLCFDYIDNGERHYHHLYKINNLGRFIDHLNYLYRNAIVTHIVKERFNKGCISHSVVVDTHKKKA